MRKTKAKAKVYCANEDCKKTIAKVGETICWNCRRQAYRLSLRIKCSKYFDDKCEDCGFIRRTIEDLNLFDFHHKIMANKEFSISNAIIRNTWPEIEKELEKARKREEEYKAYNFNINDYEDIDEFELIKYKKVYYLKNSNNSIYSILNNKPYLLVGTININGKVVLV